LAVYVDPLWERTPKKGWRWNKSCHLFADSLEELHAFAETIGMKREWFQDTKLPHYDLTEARRHKAVKEGAIEVDLTWLKQRLRTRKI
jgi:hypothetical protein